MSTAPAQTTATRVTTVIAVVVVAFIAALVSYFHVAQIAAQSGEAWRSWLFPAMYDGLMVAASMVLLERKRAQENTSWLGWGALVSGVLLSLGANIADAIKHHNPIWLAGSAPVVFFVAFELLLDFRKRRSAKDSERSETPEVPTVRDQANPQLARAYGPTYATVGAAATATGADRVQLDQSGRQPVSQASVTSPVLEREASREQSEDIPRVSVPSEAKVEPAVASYPKPVAVAPRQRQAVSVVVQPAKVTAADVRACQRAHPSWTNAQVANELEISVETLYRRLKSKEARAS
jgi:hypothetical protein